MVKPPGPRPRPSEGGQQEDPLDHIPPFPVQHFQVLGTGSLGGKVDDLVQHAPVVESVGLRIQGGTVLATSNFDEFMRDNGFNPETVTAEDVQGGRISKILRGYNNQVLDAYSDAVLAVRSSAVGEKGGIGIYESRFFVPSGNREGDLELLAQAEMQVYASFFGRDAKEWHEKQAPSSGMAILIQPVVGKWYRDEKSFYDDEEHFMPSMAGVAYSDQGGAVCIRFVPGLGDVVVGGGTTSTFMDILTRPPQRDDIRSGLFDGVHYSEIRAISSKGLVP